MPQEFQDYTRRADVTQTGDLNLRGPIIPLGTAADAVEGPCMNPTTQSWTDPLDPDTGPTLHVSVEPIAPRMRKAPSRNVVKNGRIDALAGRYSFQVVTN